MRATFSNGASEDVTAWSRFASADETVAQVDDRGRVTIKGPGETAVSVSFLTGVAMTRVRSPFPTPVPDAVFADAARHNRIDDLVIDKLRQMQIPPSGLAGDAVFIRRAYLDAAGILPTRAEVEAFVADTAPDKRARLVDALLKRPEFVDYWTYKWSDLLLVSSRSLSRNNVRAFYGWIRDNVAANTPWDRFVYELTTASGRTDENGAASYFLIHRNPIEIAENYTQAFLGITLTCARCHNHPMEKWTQTDYYGFANLFARVAMKEDGGASAKGDTATIVSTDRGRHPAPAARRGRCRRARSTACPWPATRSEDRRAYVATWLTSPANTQFARTVVNRVWANYFGRGLVHPFDDLRYSNPASNEPLLDGAERGVRRRRLRPARADAHDHAVGRVSAVRRDHARQREGRPVLLALSHAPAAGRSDPRRVLAGHRRAGGLRRLPARDPGACSCATRAWTRISSSVFGRPERVLTSSAERMQDPTLPQALHTINGETLNNKLMADAGVIASDGGGRALERRGPDRALLVGVEPPAQRRRAHRDSGAPRR